MDLKQHKNMSKQIQFRSYNLKTKKKNRLILNPVIEKTSKGSYIAKGHDEDGTPLKCLVTKIEADAAIKSGYAK